MSSTLPPNILNLKHCEISTGSCWQSGPGPGACHQLPPWAHTHTHTHTHVKCTCIFAKLWLSTFRNFCNSIMVSQRLWRKNTDLDDYLNTEVNKAAILHIFNYYNFLECWLFAWPRYPHQPRFCDSRAQTGFACQLQNSSRFPKHRLYHSARLWPCHHQKPLQNSLWLHTQVILCVVHESYIKEILVSHLEQRRWLTWKTCKFFLECRPLRWVTLFV